VWEPGTSVWEPESRVWELAHRVWEFKREVWELSSHQLPLNLTPGFEYCAVAVLTTETRNPAIAEGPRDAGVPVEIW